MTTSFIELNPPDVQAKMYRLYAAIALVARLFFTGAQVGDDALQFGDIPEGLLQHPSAAMAARPHGSDWTPHNFRDLLIRQLLSAVTVARQVQGHPVGSGQEWNR
jgi:hypothetical protein